MDSNTSTDVSLAYPTYPEPEFEYSDPIIVKKWNGGSLTVKIGFVRKHPEKRRIVLSKYWAGNQSSTFYIKDEDEWNAINAAIKQLWPELVGALTKEDIKSVLQKVTRETELLDLITQYPDLLANIPDNINILSLSGDKKESLRRFLAAGGEVALSVIEKLSDAPLTDLEQFSRVLEELRLSTITSLVTHITGRLKFIDLFEKVVFDDAAFERRGEDSIHNLLKSNMWILDRNYSILFDDITLKQIIWDIWKKKTTDSDASKRPDFLCMRNRSPQENSEMDLVIVEIKRPSITIKMEHIVQAMGYKSLIESRSGKSVRSFTVYVIGRQLDLLTSSNDLSTSGYIVKTYHDLISEARMFYEEYLNIVKSDGFTF